MTLLKELFQINESEDDYNDAAKAAYMKAKAGHGTRWEFGEDVADILMSPEWSFYYAKNIIGNRWQAAEDIIASDEEFAFYYAEKIIHGEYPTKAGHEMLLNSKEYGEAYEELIDYIGK